jgi:hypothetical protein
MAAIEAPVVFAAMLCDRTRLGGNAWAAIGRIIETEGVDGATAWLGVRGRVRCNWMDSPTIAQPLRYVLTGDAVQDAVWYDAGLFTRIVSMSPRKDGSFSIKPACAAAVLTDVWAYNLGHFRSDHRVGVSEGGDLSGERPMLSRRMRDAVHDELADDRVKKGAARVDGVERRDFVALMKTATKAVGKKTAEQLKARRITYTFKDPRHLDRIMGGAGWDAVFHKGDAGMHVVVTSRPGPDGARYVPAPIKVAFLEREHKEYGLRGYGHVLMSFRYDWDKDPNRRLIGI